MRYAVVKKDGSYTIVPAGDIKDNACFGIVEAESWEEAFDAASKNRSVPDAARLGLMEAFRELKRQLRTDQFEINEEQALERLFNIESEGRERTLRDNWRDDRYVRED